MGTLVPFYGNPAVSLYAPALDETGYVEEHLATVGLLADHDHGDAGGHTLAFGLLADMAPSLATANAVGTSVLPSRADHVHAHGDLSGATLHSDYSLTTHDHGSTYAPLVHTHGTGSGSDWTVNTDATYGDFLTANLTDPTTTGTQVTVREHPTGVLMIRQGASGAAATNIDLLGPTLSFVQDNADPDGTSPDMILNGQILFTKHATGERLIGDIGIDYPTFPWHRGDLGIYSVRRQPTIGMWTGSTNMGWRLGQRRHNDEPDYLTHSYTRNRLNRFVVAIEPDWAGTEHTPWQMDVDEDGNLWARGEAEFGGHNLWLGTNNVDGYSQDDWMSVVPIPDTDYSLARTRHTLLNIMACPPVNDAVGTGAGIIFYPWLDPTARGGNSPSSAAWPAGSKTAVGNVANTFGIVFDHSVRKDEARGAYHNAVHPGIVIYGTNEPAASTYGAIISTLTLYRDDGGVQRDYAGLLWSYGAKHSDVRVHGTYGYESGIFIARGDDWGGGNRRGRLVFSDSDFGFSYEGGPHFELGQYDNVSTAPGYEPQWNMAAGSGMAIRFRDTYSGVARTVAALGPHAATTERHILGFSNRTNIVINGQLLVGAGNGGGTGMNGNVIHIMWRDTDGHWYQLGRGAGNAAVWADRGTTMPT